MSDVAMQRGFPTSAREGLNQYLQLGGNSPATILDRQDAFGHLAEFVQHHALNPGDGEAITPPHDEVVSRLMYVPDELKPEDSPLRNHDIFAVKALFVLNTYGMHPGRGEFRLGVVPIQAGSRDGALKALVEEREKTAVRSGDVGSQVLRVAATVEGEGPEAKLIKPTVGERQDGEMVESPRVSEGAKSALRLFLAPHLDPRVKTTGLVVDRRARYPYGFAYRFGVNRLD